MKKEDFMLVDEIRKEHDLVEKIFFYKDTLLHTKSNKEIGDMVTKCLDFFKEQGYLIQGFELYAEGELMISCVEVPK